MTCQGFYSSEIYFSNCGDQTRIECSLEIRACLPSPLTLRWIPDGLMGEIAHHRFNLRTDEIIESFIDRSIRAYRPDLPEID